MTTIDDTEQRSGRRYLAEWTPSIGCTVVEISDRSARISVPNEEFVSNEFKLLFGGTKKVGRQCEVVGRNRGEILVHFLK